jgi:tRNA nucleotidyltransferase (CCA-adding enzyme)
MPETIGVQQTASIRTENATMKAAHIMRQPVLATTPWTPVHDVLAQLIMNDISGMPVVDRDGNVIGVVTQNDILRTFVEDGTLGMLAVSGIMSPDPIMVDVETPLAEVMQTIYDEGILRVPVLEHGQLVGIISRSDLIMALAQPGYVGDPEFPVFHRQQGDMPNPARTAPPPEHLVPADGW